LALAVWHSLYGGFSNEETDIFPRLVRVWCLDCLGRGLWDGAAADAERTRSPLGFEQTVNTIIEKVKADGQVVPKVYDFRKSLLKHVGTDVGETTVIEICYPEQAAKLLAVAGQQSGNTVHAVRDRCLHQG